MIATTLSERAAPRRRGLFDATLMLLLLYAVWAKTPCGALPVYAWRKANDQPTPSLIATFRGRETAVDLAPAQVLVVDFDAQRGVITFR